MKRLGTLDLLRKSCIWPGMSQDVDTTVQACRECSLVNAAFNSVAPQLKPLPLELAGYRWHVDTVGPYPKSKGGKHYIVVWIEAATK